MDPSLLAIELIRVDGQRLIYFIFRKLMNQIRLLDWRYILKNIARHDSHRRNKWAIYQIQQY